MSDEIREEAIEAGDIQAEQCLEDTVADTETEMEPEEEVLPELSGEEVLAAAEAILFAMGRSVEIEKIAYALNLDGEQTKALLEKLNASYEDRSRGIFINFLEDRVQLCTKKDYYAHLIRIATQPKKPVLTQTVLETLSIVAYKQPVTKGDIERIRGVKSDFAVNKLVEYGLIEEVGRLDAPGRPILFATTEEFLRRFGVSSVDTLPNVGPEQLEEFEQEARQEITV